MIPGFVSIFKDDLNKVHLYFYQGLTDNNNNYYNALDLSNCLLSYNEQKNNDGSIEYIFDSKIKSITCKLIHSDNINKDIIKLTI